MKTWLGAALLVAAMMLSGCGGAQGPTPAEKAAASKSAAAEKAAKDRAEAAAKRKAHQTAVFKECQEYAGPLDTKLGDLNSRLGVGMPLNDYGNRVGAAQSAFDSLIKKAKANGGISGQCINRVITPLSNAMLAYENAYQVWNNCNYPCSVSSGDAKKKVQGAWLKASNAIDKADTALAKLQPA